MTVVRPIQINSTTPTYIKYLKTVYNFVGLSNFDSENDKTLRRKIYYVLITTTLSVLMIIREALFLIQVYKYLYDDGVQLIVLYYERIQNGITFLVYVLHSILNAGNFHSLNRKIGNLCTHNFTIEKLYSCIRTKVFTVTGVTFVLLLTPSVLQLFVYDEEFIRMDYFLIVEILTNVVILLVEVGFVCFALLVGAFFDDLNEKLALLDGNTTEIRKLRNRYKEICLLMSFGNDCYKTYNFFGTSLTFAQILTGSFNYLIVSLGKKQLPWILYVATKITYFMTTMLFIAYVAEESVRKSKYTATILHKVMDGIDYNARDAATVKQQLHQFSLQIMQNNSEFSFYGLSMTRALIFVAIGSAFSYVVIIIQYQIKDA